MSKIGIGGMGAVYLAEHPLIGKRVALKVIHKELATNREVVQRFFQEARAVNQIGNEHIVEIHDFGATPEGAHFYIMEYLEGRTLATTLAKDGPLEVMRALHVAAQIAHALGAAHDAGVLHRDLKPDNIMLMLRLGDPDFVKVLDFGLAKMFTGDGNPVVKTAAGVLLGTPQYMSPEACESKPGVDHRTDIYALGILMFQMMTGKLPFDGESMGEVLVKQVMALPPAPRGFNPTIPPSVEQIILRCLAKPVDQRFQSMTELRDALLDPEAYLRASPPIARARSVAPGEAKVDARAVAAHAAHAARPPAEPWQVAPTIMGDAPASAPAAAAPRMTGAVPVPGLAQPVAPNQNTMRIATPVGYSSRPPRKMWPIVLVLGLFLGLIGGAFAVAWVGRGEATPAEATPASATDATVAPDAAPARLDATKAVASVPDAGAGSAANTPVDAASSPDAAAADPTQTAMLTIDSTPSHAQVFGPDGTLLGKTPVEVAWPISDDPIELEFRLGGYRRKIKSIVVSGNTTVGVQLDRMPQAVPHVDNGRGKGSGKRDNGNGLIKPE